MLKSIKVNLHLLCTRYFNLQQRLFRDANIRGLISTHRLIRWRDRRAFMR